MPPLRSLDRVDIANDVSDRHVRRRKLFDKTAVTADPIDLRFIAVQLNSLPAECTKRREGVIVYLRPGNDRDLVVEQFRELPDDAALCLTAKSKKNEVVSSEYGVYDLRDHRFVVANNARKQSFARL